MFFFASFEQELSRRMRRISNDLWIYVLVFIISFATRFLKDGGIYRAYI